MKPRLSFSSHALRLELGADADLRRFAHRGGRCRPTHLFPGGRARVAPGRDRAVPDLEPRPHRAVPDAVRLARRSSPAQSEPESFWLAFVVMLHVGSAVGLLIYFWRDWVADHPRVLPHARRRAGSRRSTERLAWLIVVASIPTGILGLAARASGARRARQADGGGDLPVVNGCHPDRRRAAAPPRRRCRRWPRAAAPAKGRGARRWTTLSYREAAGIGVAQSTALIAGISRDGVCMTAGLLRGLDNEDAARFAFLLATPIILAAGLFKLARPDRSARRHGVRGAGRGRGGLRGRRRGRLRPLPAALLQDATT